jgi:predicted transposase YbfD/YdcC
MRVERNVCSKGKQTHETAYFISDIRCNKADFFAKHIRNHWAIENRLHWVKDVVMNEDRSRTTSGMAAENLSIIRNIVINLFRLNGQHSIILCAVWFCATSLRAIAKQCGCKSID